MVKRREKMKKEDLQLSIDIYEKRYQAKDYTGQLLQEYTAATNKSRYFINILIIKGIKINQFLIGLHLHLYILINSIIIRQATWYRIQINGTRLKTIQAYILTTIICKISEISME